MPGEKDNSLVKFKTINFYSIQTLCEITLRNIYGKKN